MNHMLGYNISNALRMKHITLSELGRRIQMHRQTISEKINEPWRFTVNEVITIAAAIGVNWKDLLEGVE